jgi:hypothetical protein
MPRFPPPDSEILSHHHFTRPGIRLWLPVTMVLSLLLCAATLVRDIRPIEILALIFLLYLAISTLVSICEISVVKEGLLIDRLLFPDRFVPWNAIDRVVVFSHEDGQADAAIEITSISLYEGLSPLNRLPGLVYGQGFRQTIVITPDALEGYSTLLRMLEQHCTVIRQRPRR